MEQNEISLPPKGHADQTQKILLLGLTGISCLLCILFGYKLSSRRKLKITQYVPCLSGLIGIVTIKLSVLLAPFTVPKNSIGRWDESFQHQYTTISVLQMYSPQRYLIPVGFTLVCCGISTMTWCLFRQQKVKSVSRQCMLVVIGSVNLITIFGTLGCLIFARHVDGDYHILFAGILFAGWACSTFITTLYTACFKHQRRRMPTFSSFVVLVLLAVIILGLSLFFIIAYFKDIFQNESSLALTEHVILVLELLWVSVFGLQFIRKRKREKKSTAYQSSLTTLETIPSTDPTDDGEEDEEFEHELRMKQLSHQAKAEFSLEDVVIEINVENDELGEEESVSISTEIKNQV